MTASAIAFASSDISVFGYSSCYYGAYFGTSVFFTLCTTNELFTGTALDKFYGGEFGGDGCGLAGCTVGGETGATGAGFTTGGGAAD